MGMVEMSTAFWDGCDIFNQSLLDFLRGVNIV